VIAIMRKGEGIGIACSSLVLLLSVSPSVVYQLPRFTSAQEHVGVVEYLLRHGTVNTQIDIYQAWPGFFSGVAWWAMNASVTNIETVARYWPIACDMTCFLLVVSIGRKMKLSDPQSWLAGTLFSFGNAVGQDYFSPQAAAYLMALALVAMSVKEPATRCRPRPVEWVSIVMLAVAIDVSHQLTPYVITGILIVLFLTRCLKSGWIIAIVLTPAAVWALVQISVVEKYFSVSGVGNVTGNLLTSPTSMDRFSYDIYGHLATVGIVAAPLAIILLGLASLYYHRNRLAVSLAVCGALPGMVIVALHYGNEDVFRATLFAIPWWALLAAYGAWKSARIRSSMVAAVVVISLLGYIAADTFNDYVNVVRPGDLSAERYFEDHAPANAVLVLLGNVHYLPVKSTARYPIFNYHAYELHGQENLSRNVQAFSYFITSGSRTPGLKHLPLDKLYVLSFEQGAGVGVADGLWSRSLYDGFTDVLRSSAEFEVVYETNGATLFKYVGLGR
jgi:hypothetical protein